MIYIVIRIFIWRNLDEREKKKCCHVVGEKLYGRHRRVATLDGRLQQAAKDGEAARRLARVDSERIWQIHGLLFFAALLSFFVAFFVC